jgi:hypothetical protein
MYVIIYTPGCNKDIEKVMVIGIYQTIDNAKNNLCKFVNIDLSTLDNYQDYPDDGGWDKWNEETEMWDHSDEPDHLQYNFQLSGETIEKLLNIYLNCKTDCVNGHLFHIWETNSDSISDIIEAKQNLSERIA